MRTTWEVWTYDVWGNAEEGYNVNDRYCQCREAEIESDDGFPTDAQIRDTFGLEPDTAIDTDGDDKVIYVNLADDGCPVGEMLLNEESPESDESVA